MKKPLVLQIVSARFNGLYVGIAEKTVQWPDLATKAAKSVVSQTPVQYNTICELRLQDIHLIHPTLAFKKQDLSSESNHRDVMYCTGAFGMSFKKKTIQRAKK